MNRTILQFAFLLSVLAATTAVAKTDPDLVRGRFGSAVDAREVSATAAAKDIYSQPPFSVECWARLFTHHNFNVILANEPKTSRNHWEIYTYIGSGKFSAYLPGYTPGEVVSNRVITDGKWHYLAMTFDGNRVKLYVDAEVVADSSVTAQSTMPVQPGPLAFGTAVAVEKLDCDGIIDDIRISNTVRNITSIPNKSLTADRNTIGLWSFDSKVKRGEFADASSVKNPAKMIGSSGISLDEIDRKSFKAGIAPMASNAVTITLKPGIITHPKGAIETLLDGQWQMVESGSESDRLSGGWQDTIPVIVPGSVHSALQTAGRIPDPKFGRNDQIAHDMSFKTWWYRKEFTRPQGTGRMNLVFDGVAIRCTVWLNGELLGKHDGMFGGPKFDITNKLKDNNTLTVKIDPAPGNPKDWNNSGWMQTVVFNNVWGWHYSSIPPAGIWQSVRIESTPTVEIESPFVAATDALKGIVDLQTVLNCSTSGCSGKLIGSVEPDNFKGKAFSFVYPVKSSGSRTNIHLRFKVPNAKLWWPNGMGEQNLYKLKLSFVPDSGTADSKQVTFGIRTIEMKPFPKGPRDNLYNWTFVVNKKPMFVHGNGWCTMDSSMDFSRARYERLISLAKLQHVQMFRGWGSGMPETDEFYDLCNRYGIMVMQEWPTAWNSHDVQPYDALEETVRLNTLRLRNNPSLVMWGGGNESGNPFGKAIDMMGRYSIELDGTRPFHRGEPCGGSVHDYSCYWGGQPIDFNMNMIAPFYGEFGLACMPDYESVLRYLPEDEKNIWPAKSDGTLVHHTPVFGLAQDWERLTRLSGGFTEGRNLEEFITGSQLSQAVGLRHPLERARTRWPECTGALYYKMNDNYPAASWSCVDWYGAPKLSHYFCQDAFTPLHACVIFDSVNNNKKALTLPVFLLDDNNELSGKKWEVVVRAYNGNLKLIKKNSYKGKGSIKSVRSLGDFTLTESQTDTCPLFTVAEIFLNGKLNDRTFYFTNYEATIGSLFKLPKTKVTLRIENGKAILSNTGKLPAVATNVLRPGHLDTFTADDNYVWLDPGESKTVSVNTTEGLTVGAWNAE